MKPSSYVIFLVARHCSALKRCNFKLTDDLLQWGRMDILVFMDTEDFIYRCEAEYDDVNFI